jgi:hypothetical protein
MALTFTALTNGNDRQEPDQTSYTTSGSLSPSADTLVLVAVTSETASGTANQPTLTGGGVTTWAVHSTYTRVTGRTTLFYGLAGASPGSAQLVADFGGQTQVACLIQAQEAAGAVLTGTNGVEAFVQGVTGQSAVNAATFNLTLTGALASADNRALAVYAMRSNRTITATSPATALNTLAGTVSAIVLTDADDAPAAEFTGTTVAWFGLLVEIAAASTTPPATTTYPRAAATALNCGVN